MDPLSIIASTAAIVQAVSSAYKMIQHFKTLPKEFSEVDRTLPLVQNTLGLAHRQLQGVDLDESSKMAIGPIVSGCKEKAEQLRDVFKEMESAKDGSVIDFYRITLLRLGKAHRVESLMQDILKGLKALAVNRMFETATQSHIAKLEEAINKLAQVESSVPDSALERAAAHMNQSIAEGGTGNQAVNTGAGWMRANFGGNNFDSGGGAMHFGMDIFKQK